MPIVETPAKVVIVDYICDSCGIGRMLPSGAALLSNPPQYPHQCNECGEQKTFRDVRYPQTIFRKVHPE